MRPLLLCALLCLASPAFASMGQDERLALMNAEMDHVQSGNDPLAAAPAGSAAVVRRGGYSSSLEDADYLFFKQKLDPRRTHTLDIGVEEYYNRYTESGVRLNGPMTGVHANYAYRPPDASFLSNIIANVYMVQAAFAEGSLKYKGSGIQKDETNTLAEVRAMVGHDVLMCGGVLVTPYFGFGYRHLFDMAGGHLSSTGLASYDRHSTYYYLPLGVQASFPHGAWTLEPSAEYDIFIAGKQLSDLGDANAFFPLGFPDVENDQKHGYGFRGSVRISYAARPVSFYIEPFIRFWNIDNSDLTSVTVGGSTFDLLEPKNHTMEVGSKFGLLF